MSLEFTDAPESLQQCSDIYTMAILNPSTTPNVHYIMFVSCSNTEKGSRAELLVANWYCGLLRQLNIVLRSIDTS